MWIPKYVTPIKGRHLFESRRLLEEIRYIYNGYPKLIALFVNIILSRKYFTASLNVYRVLYGISCRLKIARSVVKTNSNGMNMNIT